ncbi:uncharacterized protein LOC116924538 [Daphnia magna]|uniref:uncharacterized protein LOC116924538 n=1 Tax=Daphnia magna TaxID=35525 RepID=UPI001E1BA5B1|nr:uncharacterized protein LOC116924538 [Daphnia magna]
MMVISVVLCPWMARRFSTTAFSTTTTKDKLVIDDPVSKESDRNRIAILEKELEELKRENAALKQQLKENDHTEHERDEAEYPESANEESDTDDENATEAEKSDEDEERDEDGVVEKVTKLEELKRRISIMKTNKQGYYSNKDAFPIKKGLIKRMKAQYPQDPAGFALKLVGELYSREFLELHKKTNTNAKVGCDSKIPIRV